MGILKALKFISMLKNLDQGVSSTLVSRKQLSLPDGRQLSLELITHGKSFQDQPLIVAIPFLGKDGCTGNKRWMVLCKILATLGYKVVIPHLPCLSRYDMDPNLDFTVADILQAIANNPSLTTQEKFSIFTLSYSGFVSISAASMPQARDYVEKIMVIGTYTRVEKVFEEILSSKRNDIITLYIKLCLIRNLLKHSGKNSELVKLLTKVLIEIDKSQYSPEVALDDLNDFLPDIDRASISKIKKSLFYSKDYLGEYGDVIEMYRMNSLRGIYNLKNLKCHVSIIHGEDDFIIPYTESTILYEHLKSAGVSTKCLITTLLSNHMSYRVNLKSIHEYISSINILSHFFK